MLSRRRSESLTLLPQVPGNQLVALPASVGQLTKLTKLSVRRTWPLRRLTACQLFSNRLTSLCNELSSLQQLSFLWLHANALRWLPLSLVALPTTTSVFLDDNPLALQVRGDARQLLPEILASTTSLHMIRDDATTLAIGLQDLELPALVTLEIIDAAFPNSIPMHLKWKLVVAVKHARSRHFR